MGTHIFHDREDDLSHCKVCNGAEGSLPSECPGVKMPAETEEDVFAGLIDYKNGAWVAGKRLHVPAFQERVFGWMLNTFGLEVSSDRLERNHRFFEEATELVQACGMTANEAHQLIDYTFGRPVGEPDQEVGGVMVTLAALCWANNLSMAKSGEVELARIETKVEEIRAKQATKPKLSPLPAHVEEALIKDTARLDWLDENCLPGFGWILAVTSAGKVISSVSGVHPPTKIREAIDKVRSAK